MAGNKARPDIKRAYGRYSASDQADKSRRDEQRDHGVSGHPSKDAPGQAKKGRPQQSSKGASGTSRKPSPSGLPREKEYECFNPGAGGPPGQQQERDKPNPEVTRDDGGAGIAGSQNEDVKGRKPRGPRGAST